MPPSETTQTFEEQFSEEINDRVAAGLPRPDAIAVQKAQVEYDAEVEKAKKKKPQPQA